MSVPTNTIQNVGRVGVREDLSNKIAELFPDDTPLLNAIGTGKCSATKTEWQTDGLAAANPANARIQGDDLANDTRTDTARVSTYTEKSALSLLATVSIKPCPGVGSRSTN